MPVSSLFSLKKDPFYIYYVSHYFLPPSLERKLQGATGLSRIRSPLKPGAHTGPAWHVGWRCPPQFVEAASRCLRACNAAPCGLCTMERGLGAEHSQAAAPEGSATDFRWRTHAHARSSGVPCVRADDRRAPAAAGPAPGHLRPCPWPWVCTRPLPAAAVSRGATRCTGAAGRAPAISRRPRAGSGSGAAARPGGRKRRIVHGPRPGQGVPGPART